MGVDGCLLVLVVVDSPCPVSSLCLVVVCCLLVLVAVGYFR